MSDAKTADSETVTIEVNGRAIEARKGEMIIQATDRAGIYIPRFCYHKHLPIAANCRMCLVDVEKAPKPLPACATPVGDGMTVHTHSERAISAQRGVMEFLLINHPLDCPICDQGGECELQDLALGFGRGVSRFVEGKRSVEDEDLGPLVETEMTRCIHCTRCVRFLDTVAGKKELGGMFRGEHTEISTYVEEGITSELSGNVIDLCPVGALTNKPYRFRARAWEMLGFPGVGPHDAVGSNVELHALRGELMRVVPRENESINQTWIADRDRYGIEGLKSEDRLTQPMIRRDGRWLEVPWDIALDEAASRMSAVVQQHGADALGGLLGPTSTLEELGLAARLIRGLGSPHVDARLRDGDVSDAASGPAFPWLGQSIAELSEADAVLLIGAYTRHDQPMINHRLRQAALRGASVDSVHVRSREWNFPMAGEAVVAPSRMVGALAAIAAALAHGSGQSVPDGVEALADGDAIGADAIAARLNAGERVTVLCGNWAQSSADAARLRQLGACIAGLAGGRFGVLPESANSVGAWIAGAVPHQKAGAEAVTTPGLDAIAMVRDPRKAYLLLNLDPTRDPRDPLATRQALQGAEAVVAVTPFADEALREVADVLLPMAAYGETAGTFVNLEGRWQSFRGLGRPSGEARPGWRVLRALGSVFDLDGFSQDSAEEVRDELARVCTAIEPVPYTAPSAIDAGASAGTAPKGALELTGGVPIYSGDPLVRRSQPLQQTPIQEAPAAWMAPATAESLGVTSGARVRLRAEGSSAGQAELAVALDEGIAAGTIWVTGAADERAGLGPASGWVTVEAV